MGCDRCGQKASSLLLCLCGDHYCCDKCIINSCDMCKIPVCCTGTVQECMKCKKYICDKCRVICHGVCPRDVYCNQCLTIVECITCHKSICNNCGVIDKIDIVGWCKTCIQVSTCKLCEQPMLDPRKDYKCSSCSILKGEEHHICQSCILEKNCRCSDCSEISCPEYIDVMWDLNRRDYNWCVTCMYTTMNGLNYIKTLEWLKIRAIFDDYRDLYQYKQSKINLA